MRVIGIGRAIGLPTGRRRRTAQSTNHVAQDRRPLTMLPDAPTPASLLAQASDTRRGRLARAAVNRMPSGVQAALRVAWRWWLHALLRHWWVRDLAAPGVFLVSGRVFAAFFQAKHPQALNNNVGVEAIYDLAVLFASVSFIRWSATWGIPEMMADVRRIARATQEPAREILRELAIEDVRETRLIVTGLTSGSYIVQNPAALQPWFARFFAKGGGPYIGVDSHLPSQFMAQYEWFLDAHASDLRGRGYPKTDRRSLATSHTDITDDFRVPETSHAYQRFWRWHDECDVDLRWIDLDDAEALRQSHGAESIDVALWPNFAVVFASHEGSDAITLSMFFPKEPAREGTTFWSLRDYVKNTLNRVETLGAVAPGLRLVSRELADAWEPYLNPRERSRAANWGACVRVLPKKQYVFDAAGGIACDSVFLIDKRGFQVFTNEVDELLADAAEIYAEKQGEQLQLTTLFWETLPDSIARRDAIRGDSLPR